MSEFALTPDVQTETRRGCASTEYRIRGALPDVLRAIEGLFKEWHPCGYGTHVHSISTENGVIYSARVSHSNSCD